MNWYKFSQFIDYSAMVSGIVNRLRQAENITIVDTNAFDDIHSQGLDISTIENAINAALSSYLGPNGNEEQLNENQKMLLATLRGQQPQQYQTPQYTEDLQQDEGMLSEDNLQNS